MAEPCTGVRAHRIHTLTDALRTALGDAGATVDEGASALISLLIDTCREQRHDDETDAKVSAAMHRLAARLNVHKLSWTLAYFDVEISGEEPTPRPGMKQARRAASRETTNPNVRSL